MDSLLTILIGLVSLCIGVLLGYLFNRKITEAKIGKAEETVERLMSEAKQKADALHKETLLEAKEEVHRLRNEFERESRERRNELQRTERRLQQREENLEKKLTAIEAREESISRKQKDIDKLEADIQSIYQQQLQDLEKISRLTREEAREIILSNVENDTRRDAAVLVKEIEAKAREEAEKKARYIPRSPFRNVRRTTLPKRRSP